MIPEIEEEIRSRIEFKMNELITAVKNTAAHNWHIAFNDGGGKYFHYWEAFEQLEKMILKERDMPPPYDEMALKKKRDARDRAVEAIVAKVREQTRGLIDTRGILSIVVTNVEKAQNYTQ